MGRVRGQLAVKAAAQSAQTLGEEVWQEAGESTKHIIVSEGWDPILSAQVSCVIHHYCLTSEDATVQKVSCSSLGAAFC